jgi:predicted outer membrane repeat protein
MLGNFSEYDYERNKTLINITVIFWAGVHEARSDKPLRFSNVDGITFIGYGHSDQVIVKNLDLRIITGTVVIQNITMQGSYIIMYRSSSPKTIYRPLAIVKCKFFDSQMILPNVELTVENSEFRNSSSTAITLYSSFAIFCGTVIFENNSGSKGGAIALIGSTLTIKSNTLVVFKNNRAYETGGAIYADNVEPRINLEGYRSYCFYMLDVPLSESNALGNFTQVLNFDNNTASLGGDHIYGAKLKFKVTVYPQAIVMMITVDLVLKQLEMYSNLIRITLSVLHGQPYQEILHAYAYVTTVVYHNVPMLR